MRDIICVTSAEMQSCIIACDQWGEGFPTTTSTRDAIALGSGAAGKFQLRLRGKVMRISLLLAAMSVLCVPMLSSVPAHAQATRAWVSGVGDDFNPCSRTAPCKTFAGAISKTAAGGEISCLDPGGFGTVTITKSMTIDCEGTLGSILASGVNGVNVNDSATATPGTIRVILRNLAINGAGSGVVGVNFSSGSSLELRNVKIFGFTSGNAQGVRVTASASQTAVFDSEISYNTNTGIFVDPVSSSALVTLQRVQLNKNLEGFRATGAGAGVIFANIQDTVASMNGSHGFVAVGGSSVTVSIQRSSSNTNGGDGIRADGAGAVINIGSSMVAQNTNGLSQANGGIVKSYGNNALDGNTSNSAGGAPTAPNLSPL